MGQYDFTYVIPDNFRTRLKQYLQSSNRKELFDAFQQCKFEYEDVGFAYYKGLKGDNWNKNALVITIEGSEDNIKLLESNQKIFKEKIELSLKPSESGFLVKEIHFLISDNIESVLPHSKEEKLNQILAEANSVLQDLIIIGKELISNNVKFNEKSGEDEINDIIRSMLKLTKKYEINDQTRHGISYNGKNAGEVDILISTKEGKEIGLFEGLKLNCVDTANIDKHIDKTINNYNALGTATFIVTYVSATDFDAFWKKYLEYISNYSYDMEVKRAMEQIIAPNASTKIAQTILSKDDHDFPVYFICFNFRKNVK